MDRKRKSTFQNSVGNVYACGWAQKRNPLRNQTTIIVPPQKEGAEKSEALIPPHCRSGLLRKLPMAPLPWARRSIKGTNNSVNRSKKSIFTYHIPTKNDKQYGPLCRWKECSMRTIHVLRSGWNYFIDGIYW